MRFPAGRRGKSRRWPTSGTIVPHDDTQSNRLGTHHLHLVPFGSRLWIEQVAFRDYLRTHPDVALDYAAMKRRLADPHGLDREAYTTAKTPFVQRLLEEALGRHEPSPAAGRESDVIQTTTRTFIAGLAGGS